jgi:hypothetical protein
VVCWYVHAIFALFFCSLFPSSFVSNCERRRRVWLTTGFFYSLSSLIPVAYTLGIYLLNLFLAFLQPKIDPSLTQDEGLEDGDAASTLPTKQDDEFRPFIRRLPEFKFWHSATRAILIAFICTWFKMFDIPVFWPVLVMYWLILFILTSKCFFFFFFFFFSEAWKPFQVKIGGKTT